MGQEHKEYTWNLFAKKLMGEATPEELGELEALLRNNPDLHYPMQTITDLWSDTRYRNKKEAEIAFNRHLDRMQDLHIDFNPTGIKATNANANTNANTYPGIPESAVETASYPWYEKTSRSRRPVLVISTITGMLLLAGLFYFKAPHRQERAILANNHAPIPAATEAGNEIYTASGSRTHLTLPDGTLVWLNAGSRITYEKNFGASLREVHLTGEAFFDVAPNASKPFVIHTTRIDVRVLGTRFNVKSYPTDKTTEATLIRGSIEVSINNKSRDKIILKPNEKLVVNNDDSISLQPAPRRKEVRESASLVSIVKPTYERNSGAIIETSWIDNKLIFQDEGFTDLARQMERWYGVTIRFENERQEDLRFTGIFEEETVQQALDALKLTANFNYTIEGNQITIHD
jgi:ferric-dicitrate binding protein FerR (iron transport regulator)